MFTGLDYVLGSGLCKALLGVGVDSIMYTGHGTIVLRNITTREGAAESFVCALNVLLPCEISFLSMNNQDEANSGRSRCKMLRRT